MDRFAGRSVDLGVQMGRWLGVVVGGQLGRYRLRSGSTSAGFFLTKLCTHIVLTASFVFGPNQQLS